MANEKEQKIEKQRFELVRILTNDAPIVIKDTKTEEQLDIMSALVNILNSLELLKRLL